MATPLKSATIFFQPGTKRPRKYRNISTPYSFETYARKSGAWYINWYDQKTGQFSGRKWLVNVKK
jgi:hypothetical protein